ncbi:hypothetical protein AA904_06700 [Geobacillus stearothermophilus]|nr:hypothetical protein [Geobacillus stearothermophilus]KQC47996.1 hypothetical protein AP057_13005 [Geobacillus sp. Sah69]KMY61321.1 hypothetical protein AA905_08715 [Geobacillus stearothermophilus]KMY61905.1 hypothetical protein AA904_06700 [Geobacillus stearothermophilus]KMY63363.1 hypothetical protein AA906_00045 [Geobacillus stearothermophilus]MED3748848.1 hypothetical protein [Geobacillus stearothermophilus]
MKAATSQRKEWRMMTKDEAARCLSVLLHELTKPWRKEKIHSDVLEIIMKLRIQAADDERYMNNLLSNIAFAGESAHALKQIWSYMLREQTFLSPQTIEAMLTDAQQAIRRRLPELTARYERPFLSIDDPLERKRQLERSYGALLLFNRIATDFLLEFVREENETAASVFFAADPNEAIEVFHHLCSVYASRWLEGLEVD